MIKLFSLKQAKKDGESAKSGNHKKASAAQLRISKGNDLLHIAMEWHNCTSSIYFRHNRAQSA